MIGSDEAKSEGCGRKQGAKAEFIVVHSFVNFDFFFPTRHNNGPLQCLALLEWVLRKMCCLKIASRQAFLVRSKKVRAH